MADIRRCPQCGAELSADVPAGLCPECLLKQGFGSQPGSSSGTEPEGSAAKLDDVHFLETDPPSSQRGGEEGASGDAGPADSGGYRGPFTAPTPEELAKHFPQLEIIELLGQGGMGAVYKARQPRLDRFVAVKILPPDAASDPAFAERFDREARALARINHPNIVAVYDSGQTPPTPLPASGERGEGEGSLFYFIMEYVDGVNLRELIRSGQCKPEEALRIVPQICEALQFAHDEGIVHRDIKPENILLDKRGRLKIADFGLARLLGHARTDYTLTGPWQVMGTPNYMAPEQMDDPLKVDHRADIYALGVVFYEMLTGELPRGRFAPPSQKVQVDVRLDEVVLRALEQEPERRYQQASEVKTDVETISRSPQPGRVGSAHLRTDVPHDGGQSPPYTTEPTWETWWFEHSPASRKMMRAALLFVAIVCLIILVSFEGQSVSTSGASRIRVGFGDPWFRYTTDEGSQLDLLSWSFGIGALGVFLLFTWFRVRRAERRQLTDGLPNRPQPPLGLRVCGCMLMLLGIVGEMMGGIGLCLLGIHWVRDARGDSQLSNTLGFMGMFVLGTLVATGGWCVLRQRNYHSALLGCLLSFALALMMKLDNKQNAFALLGFVPGAVALYYLLQPEIRGGFSARHIPTRRDGGVAGVESSRPQLKFTAAPEAGGSPTRSPARRDSEQPQPRHRTPEAKTMGIVVTIAVFVVLLLLAVFPYWRGPFRPSIDATRAESDEARILGTWIEVSGIGFDEEVRNDPEEPWKMTYLANGEFTVHYQVGDMETVDKGTYKLDATKSPKTIDLVNTTGVDKGLHLVGIYELDGDSLKTCWAYGGGSVSFGGVRVEVERPKEFSAPPGSGRSFYIQKREKLAAANSGAPSTSRPAPELQVIGELRRFVGHKDSVWRVAFSPDGLRALSAGGGVWRDVPQGVRLQPSTDHSIRIWDVATGQEIRRFDGHPGPVSSAIFSRDGNSIYSSSDVFSSGRDLTLQWDAQTGEELRRFEGVGIQAISPDGRQAVFGNSEGATALWELDSGQALRALETREGFNDVDFSADGRRAFAGNGADATARLLDLETGKELRRFGGQQGPVQSVAILPDGRRAVTGSWDGSLWLWELETGKELRRFKGHTGIVMSAAITPDGRHVLTASYDSSVRLWDIETGAELYRFEGHASKVHQVVLSPDGRYALSGSDDGTMRLWKLPTAGDGTPRADSDEARIQGTWIEESGIGFDGQVGDQKDPWIVTYLANGEFTVRDGDIAEAEKGNYRLDATQSPKAIDLVFTAGYDKGLVLVGIYELDGDRLKTCWAYGGGSVPTGFRRLAPERPKEFSAPAGSGRSLSIQKREKPAVATSGAPSSSTPPPAAGSPAKVRLVTRDRSLGKIEPDSDPTTLVVSPDSRRFAYVTKRGEKFAVVLDGKIGPEHGRLGKLVFSPDSKRLTYAGEWQGKIVAMEDGKPGNGFVSVETPVFSLDSQRVAYQVRDGDKWFIAVAVGQPFQAESVVEGTRYDGVGSPVFSPNPGAPGRVAYSATRGGKNLIVLDGKEGPEFDQVGEPVFSADSARLAYVAQRDGKRRIVADGEEGQPFDDAHAPTFSPDSHHLAFIAVRGDQFFVVLDGQELTAYEQLFLHSLRFSPDSKRFGFAAVRDGKFHVVVDGKEGPAYDQLAEYGSLFSPDSKRVAYKGARGGKWHVVVDGVESPAYDQLGAPPVQFSPDSRRVAYVAKRGRDSFVQFVVVDGVPGKPYDGIIGSGLSFSPDSKHVVYGTGRGGKGFVVVDGHECWEYDGFLRGAYFVFGRPDAFHTLAPRGDEIFRVDVEITEKE